MKELEKGKKYRTHSDDFEITLEYEVIDILNRKVVYKVLESSTTCYSGINCSNYDKKSKFVINSEELI